MDKFSPKQSKRLEYYVYIYSDPVTKVPFYVGKGKGNRAFAHLHDGSESDKARKIAEIQARGRQPLIEILVFGLDEKAAYKVEAAAIDLLGLKNLTNKQAGHESSLYGRIEVSELDARFDHGELAESDFLEDAVLVKVNQLYRNGMSDFELYEVTRGFWRVDTSKVEGIHLALAVYDGMVLEAYEIAAWLPAGSGMCAARSVSQAELAHRMEFVGRVANRCIGDHYVGKGVSGLYAPGSANPIRYVKAAYSRKALVEIHRVLEDVELTGEKREWCSSFSSYDPAAG
ncbi:MAG: LEM-3-like GIY-YIG domain-containing protein [Collinsella sp.]